MHTNYINIKAFLLIVFLNVTFVLQSQTNISSPYSRFGLGQIHRTYGVKALSMGGASFAQKTNDCINISNPATYAGFDTTSFLFEGGINGIFSQLKNNSDTVYTSNLSLNYLLFGFPISKKIAFSFGLLPFSNMGYSLSDSNTVTDIGKMNYYYKGEGGFNKFFGGTAVKITRGLSVGANMSYLFGSLNKTRTITFPNGNNIYSIREKNDLKISDIVFDYGLHYEIKLKNNNALAIGLVTGLSSKINASENILTETFLGQTYSSTYIKDTLKNTSTNGTIIIPPFYGGGIMYNKNNKWLLEVDYKFYEWSKYEAFGIPDSLKNTQEASIGFAHFPSNNLSNNIWSKTTYRVGLRFAQNYLEFKNTQLNEYAISFGFGFPMQRNKSSINVGFELGQRGTVNNNLIKETFGMVFCSLSIYDRWFIRRKYD